MAEVANENCYAHGWERAAATCRTCAHPFCSDCLVYAFGPKKRPYCVGCALVAAGVRTTAGHMPTLPVLPTAAAPAAPDKESWRARRQRARRDRD